MPVYNLDKRGTRRSGVFNKAKVEKELTHQAEKDKPVKLEQSIGIMRAREIASEAGIDAATLNAALAAGEIFGAEKQGVAWHISPTHLAEWIRSQP